MKYSLVACLFIAMAVRAGEKYQDLGKRFEKALHTGKVSEMMTCWIGEKQVEKLIRKSLRDTKKVPEDKIEQVVKDRLKGAQLHKKGVEKSITVLLEILKKNKIKPKELTFAKPGKMVYGSEESRVEVVKLYFTYKKDHHLVLNVEGPVPYDGTWYFFGLPDMCWEVHRIKTDNKSDFWNERHYKNLKLDDSKPRYRGRDFKVFDSLGKAFLKALQSGDVDKMLKCWVTETETKAIVNASNQPADRKALFTEQALKRLAEKRPKIKKQLASILQALKKKNVNLKKLVFHELASNAHRRDGVTIGSFARIKFKYGKKVIITFTCTEDIVFINGKWYFGGGTRFSRELEVTGSPKVKSIRIER